MSSPDASLILVVDDNESGRYGKSRILRQAGFEVIEAATGSEALQMIAAHAPRLVVLDINLPDVDGWEVSRRLKAEPSTSSVIVLQVSATHIHEEDTVRSLEAGADASLTEPLEPTVLVATVRALLRARAAEDALREALVREQAAREAAEGANRAKDEFLAMLSHELRSPLGAIVTWVTLLRTGKVEESRRARALEAIERNTRLQAKLIEDLLDVSRIISGKLRLETGLVDLAAVVDAAVDSARPVAEAKDIELGATVDPMLGLVSGDATRLQQVVWNLLSNAVKFTPRNGRIHVHVESRNSRAHIRVTDTGRGIDPAFLPHIFERFRQADSSSTRSEGGLGLGLAIVRHVVALHGGTVEAESAGPGQGSTFVVQLPLPAIHGTIASAKPGSAGRERIPVLQQPSLTGLHILVLDDECDARDAVSAVLEGCGARVTPVGSVRDAIAALELKAPDLIVSDIAMPDEDGFRFIGEVRNLPTKGRVPALALTAYASAEERGRILAAGFDSYLAKPIEASELAATVARLARSPTSH